ncbi:MAG: hypothetical protein JXR95_11410 [Deltaproteobacteria bacterium]|nr:hypothetical protein [Deltaproteobacteria bacterium]
MNKKNILIVSVLSAVMLASPNVKADGVSIHGNISRSQVIEKSKIIFTAKITKVKHEYSSRKAYGRNNKYISNFRAGISILKILAGNEHLSGILKKKNIWLSESSKIMPGKWIIVRDHYNDGYSLGRAKTGDIIIVYLQSEFSISEENSKTRIYVRYMDEISRLTEVKKLIPIVLKAKQKKWRKSSKCSKPDTWQYKKGCHSMAQIKKMHKCPGKSRILFSINDGSLSLMCLNHRNKYEGVYYHWYKSGMAASEESFSNGVQTGKSRFFHENGNLKSIRYFKNGHPHGKSSYYGTDNKMTRECIYKDKKLLKCRKIKVNTKN